MSWLIVLWYSGEAEAFDAQSPYWLVSLGIAVMLGIFVGAPRDRPFAKTDYQTSRPLALAPKFRPVEIGMAMAAGQFLIALVLAEEYTFILLGALMIAISGLIFSVAALAGILLRQVVRGAL